MTILPFGGNVLDFRQFFNQMKGKRIAFLGAGISNTPLILSFLEQGARVYVCDRRNREQLGELATKLEAAGAELRLGENYLERLEVEIIFLLPE